MPDQDFGDLKTAEDSLAPPTSEAPAPTFCILIPTYNGSHFLRRAIVAHAKSILANRIDYVEIIVSDNASTPETERIVRALMKDYPFLRYIRQPVHLDTAEEHFFEALRCIEHDYVWSFGDDDIPLPHALPELLGLARSGRYGCIMGNLRVFTVEDRRIHPGRTPHAGVVPVLVDQVGPISEIIAGVGFQTVAACLSTVVVRRKTLLSAPVGDYLAISPIYSHVAAYLDAFADDVAYFVARPILDYRLGATTNENWERFAERRAQAFNTPWTFGILRLFGLLHDRHRIPESCFFRIKEHAHDHIFFLWTHVLHRLVDDFEGGVLGRSTVDKLSLAALDDLCMIFSAAEDPAPLELVEQLRSLVLRTEALLEPGREPQGRGLKWSTSPDHREAVQSWALKRAGEIRATSPSPEQGAVWILAADSPVFAWGEELAFVDPGADTMVVSGMSAVEEWGRWTDGALAHLRLRCPSTDDDVVVRLTTPMVYARDGRCELVMWVNAAAPKHLAVTSGGEITYTVGGRHVGRDGRLDIHLRLLRPKTVDESPVGETRALGVGLATLRIDRAGGHENGGSR